ncbi:MAG: ATP-binding protein, partial [Myxococcales bacterium]
MPAPSENRKLFTLVDAVLAGAPTSSEEVARALAGFDPEVRAIAERLVELAREKAASKRQLAQVAKLAELGLSTAELVHELRQPLAGVAGFAQLLTADPANADATTWSKEIVTQALRMEQMLDRVRRHIRAAPTGTSVSDLNYVVKDAAGIFLKLPRGVKIEFDLAAGLPPVRGEPNRLIQIVTNLIANARDAMESRPGAIRLKTRVVGADQVELLVSDEGTGIPTEVRARLFEPFFSTKGERGTGLGLYICREISRESGGELQLVESTAPATTTFSLRLPLAAAQKTEAPGAVSSSAAGPVVAPATGPGPATMPAAVGTGAGLDRLYRELLGYVRALPSKRRVLVVDDEVVIRRMVRVLLAREAGLELLEASTGEEAVELLGQAPAQVVLTDKNLPGISGLDVLRRAKSRDPLVEGLMMTGYPSLKSALEAMEAGASDYLVKPFEHVAILRERLHAAMARNRRHQIAVRMTERLGGWSAEMLAALGGNPPARLAEIIAPLQLLASQRQDEALKVAVLEDAELATLAAKAGATVERFGSAPPPDRL